MNEELFSWVALHAAGVPPRAREEVERRGAQDVLASGFVAACGRPVSFAPKQAIDRAVAILPFTGRVLGGPSRTSLGPWVDRRAPLCAYARGTLALPRAAGEGAVAIVGPRKPTLRALALTKEIATAIAGAGGIVVSGGAHGVDRAAHEAALDAGGRTIAVLGDPLAVDGDERRPWMQERFDAAPGRALSLTTSGPWVGHHDRLFVARNHHIAALTQAVLVIEGSEGSGTRHTAAAAHKLGIALWALLGDTAASAVPNGLVDQGLARPLNPLRALEQLLGRAPAAKQPTAVPPEGDPLLRALAGAGGRALVDVAARLLGVSAREILVQAALLELDGCLRREGQWLVSRS